ncbi:MAG: hypothetical protein P8M22_13300 [Phycisphaerales bacterium]|nr:hypothetical protein [Phycisphaerales bacterium]
MNHSLTRTALSICLLAVLTVIPSQSTFASISTAESESSEAIEQDKSILFSFAGGTASELFAQLAKKFPDFPVILGQKAQYFEISGFVARISKPGTIVELVCDTTGKAVIPVSNGDSKRDAKSIPGELLYRNVNSELVHITFMESWGGQQIIPTLFVEVFSIQELLTSGMDVEEIFGTVEAGIELKGDSLGTSVRIHLETGVLFVKGPKSVNSMVGQTIEALNKSAQWRVSASAIEAKEGRMKSEALDYLDEANKEAMNQGMRKLEDLKKREKALRERDRQRELEKDAALEKEIEENEDE